MIDASGMRRPRLGSEIATVLLAAWLVLGAAANAQTPARPPQAAAASGPAWSALTPAQQSALAPLTKDWPAIDAPRKQKWLEIAARFPSMPPEERQRIQQRMAEWARMSPEERGRARLQFQEARQIDPRERQARWDAYLALPADERRALSRSASTVPKAGAAGAGGPAGAPPSLARSAVPQGLADANRPKSPAAARTSAAVVVQAKPGASTTLISKTASPPPHVQAGRPKISAEQGKVDRSTLLPHASPPRDQAPASAAQ